MQSSCHDGMGTWFGSPPQLLEPCRVGGGVLDGVLNIPVSEVILSEPRVCALVGQGEAASVAQHVGMSEQGQGSGFTSFLLPLVASINRSTSCEVRCFRSPTRSPASVPRRQACPTPRFSGFSSVYHFVESLACAMPRKAA